MRGWCKKIKTFKQLNVFVVIQLRIFNFRVTKGWMDRFRLVVLFLLLPLITLLNIRQDGESNFLHSTTITHIIEIK